MQEMLKNPGFEKGTPDDWRTYSTGTTQKYIYPEPGRIGGSSVAIECPTREVGKRAAWVQNIQIDPKNKYKLSGWLKAQNIIGTSISNRYGASIILDWKDAAWKYLSTSPIMIRQTGTVTWTYFEGDVTPHPNAANATIILDLLDCSGKVWFDDISFYEVSPPVSSHPNMYLNQTEINTIKSKLSQEPWKSAYNQLMNTYVPEALSMSIQSVVYKGKTPPGEDKHIYWTSDDPFAPSADRADYQAAIKVGKAVRDLGLAYSLTNDSSKKIQYANKAIQLINGWCLDSVTFMRPRFGNYNSQIELAITMPGMFYGADLIWNYSGWDQTKKNNFKNWVKQLIDIAKSKDWCHSPTFCQNHENWRLVLISSGTVITENSDYRNYVFNRYKELIPQQIDSSGKMRKERDRQEKSLFYSTYAINAMIQIAEIARHYNVDLYNYKLADGKGLEKTLDYHTYYLVHPEKAIPPEWPVVQTFRVGANAPVYELAYTFKKKTSYKDVITKWGRPMYEERIMGPVTLTQGSTFS